ncbi:hypothetical protein ABH892_005501 [Paenibacillus sp. RC254]|uniref:hypothetical protein n=1 Tax=unclassified Paenibacillus TaxID=185978 RepID=UPI0024BB546D|nr:hypothetical protein [Paenibacillus sp. RC334]
MSKLISDKEKFEEAVNLVKRAFDHEKRLPEQIFNVPFQKTCVFDFDKAMSYSFWHELERLINLSNDPFILMAVLDPHPVDYFYKEFSRYNFFILSRDATADEYWKMIESSPEESPADAIVFNSEVVVWLSPSMKWAIWGERSYGICIVGLSEEISSYKSESCLTIDTAISDLVSLNFGNIIPDEVVSKLLLHYNNMD